MSLGLVGKKIGMTREFFNSGISIPVTVVKIEKGRVIDVQKKISADPRVFSVYDVTGDWDSMVLARVKDRSDLDDLTKTVFTLDGITRSYTHVVLNTVKERGVNLPPQDR